LVLIAPETAPDHAIAANWAAGSRINGTPGTLAPPAPSFASWQQDQFTPAQLADVLISGPNADPDQDGIVNLLEYAFLAAPLSPNRPGDFIQAGTTSIGPETYLTITFPARDPVDDLFYQPQISGNLARWDEGTAHLIPTSNIDQGNGIRALTYRSILPVSTRESQYIRVRVIRNNP
jgi:hypothetical protein